MKISGHSFALLGILIIVSCIEMRDRIFKRRSYLESEITHENYPDNELELTYSTGYVNAVKMQCIDIAEESRFLFIYLI